MPLAALIAVEEDDTPVRTRNYVEEVVPRYSPEDFFRHFRMTRNVFQELLENIANRLHIVSTIPVEKKLLFGIWMLAKPESFRSSCDRFHFSKGTGHYVLHEIIRLLSGMMEDEIHWPTMEEARTTATFLYEKYRFPGIIGAIDGCRIPIKAPTNNQIDYYNRHSYHSVVLQGVCGHRMIFTDIFVGMPGRVHDARVFRSSPLHGRINDNQLIPGNLHLVGDSAYPLLKNVMVPFRDNGHFTQQQHHYNTVLSKCRTKVEQAFGRLKGKWRRLKYLDMDIENIPYAITAACVLHNYTLRRSNMINMDEEVIAEDIHVMDIENNEEGEEEAVIKRNNILAQL